MRIVVAIDERLAETPLQRVPALTPMRDAEIVLVHVLDTGGPDEWERGAGRHLLRHGPPHAGRERMQAADRAEGERILARAAEQAGSWGARRVEKLLLEGSPKHEVRALLDGEGADLLVIFVHGHEVGPKSIRKEARFLIDHAACAVLVVKGDA